MWLIRSDAPLIIEDLTGTTDRTGAYLGHPVRVDPHTSTDLPYPPASTS